MKACALRLAGGRDLQKARRQDEAKAKRQTTAATHKAGWLVKVGCGEESERPAGCWQEAGAAAGPRCGGRLPAPACPRLTYPAELRASGASRSIRAAPATGARPAARQALAGAWLKEPQACAAGGGGSAGSAVTLSPLLALSSHWLRLRPTWGGISNQRRDIFKPTLLLAN